MESASFTPDRVPLRAKTSYRIVQAGWLHKVRVIRSASSASGGKPGNYKKNTDFLCMTTQKPKVSKAPA